MIITDENNSKEILSSPAASSSPASSGFRLSRFSRRQRLIIALAAAVLAAAGIFGFWFWKSRRQPAPAVTATVPAAASTSPGTLPATGSLVAATTTAADISNVPVEYLAFSDFYKAPDNSFTPGFTDYQLPQDVKIGVRNYNDVARKLDLDPAISSLDTEGFGLLDNPWPKEAGDFYALYSKLADKQISPFVSSDFIIYYYQSMSKKVFEDIEESIFYDNLWSVLQELYDSSRTRYEARLASIGNINDSVLEGERLETAFFAVALDLLKPAANQVASSDKLDDSGKFRPSETQEFYFVVPPYLQEDVLKEAALIEAAGKPAKSPVLRYTRDYSDFQVPQDYEGNAKLHNFYLASAWLNSVFPLDYRDQSCPKCLLDKDDWRLSTIAAALISSDISNLSQTKNQWARIYKVMSFYQSLRDELDYVDYRDTGRQLFGDGYDATAAFDDSNKEASANMEKLRSALDKKDFSAFLGALDKKADQPQIGFRMLASAYSQNDYIFGRLTAPAVGTYQKGKKAGSSNLTACATSVNSSLVRCNGFALDAVNLIQPLDSDYFSENTAYASYDTAASALRQEFDQESVWHATGYWSNMSAISAYLNTDRTQLPAVYKTEAWKDRLTDTAAAAWINQQLPLPDLSSTQLSGTSGLSSTSIDDAPYVETDLGLVNELLAQNSMASQMLSALQISQNVLGVSGTLNDVDAKLTGLKKIIAKELAGQALDDDDRRLVSAFTTEFSLKEDPSSSLTLRFPAHSKNLKEDLGSFKLLVISHQDGNDRIFSVGPVWNYKESR